MENEDDTGLAVKLKLVALFEALALAIALIVPVSPRKDGKPTSWPESWEEYAGEVAMGFLLVNLLYAVIMLLAWFVSAKTGESRSRR